MKIAPSTPTLSMAATISSPVTWAGQLGTVELYDPIVGSWLSDTNTLNVARWKHTATMLPGGRILVAGGINVYGVTNSTEIYEPDINPATVGMGAVRLYTHNPLYDFRGIPERGSLDDVRPRE